MEYLIGSTVTLLSLAVSYVFLLRKSSQAGKIRVPIKSQSQTHSIIGPMMKYALRSVKEANFKTQATEFHDSKETVVVFFEDHAYWIQDSNFYTAEVQGDGINMMTQKRVDTMSMDKVQLNQISFIVDKLKGRPRNENSNPRNSEF